MSRSHSIYMRTFLILSALSFVAPTVYARELNERNSFREPTEKTVVLETASKVEEPKKCDSCTGCSEQCGEICECGSQC